MVAVPRRASSHAASVIQLNDEASLEAAGTFWPKDLVADFFAPEKPRLLVGTKLDLREENPGSSSIITASKAKKQMGPLHALR